MPMVRRLIALVLSGGLALTALVVPGSPAVRVARAACPGNQRYAIARITPGAAADGVRAEWILRTLDAPDWADGGHTNTTVWMGTNGDPGQWVEVGVTDGFHGQNAYKFYSAHVYKSGGVYYYADASMGKAPVLGRVVTFTVRQTAVSFRGDVTDFESSQGIGWSHHALPVLDYDIGLEYTCQENARADKHFVVTSQYRRASDGVWLNSSTGNGTTGFLLPPDAPADIHWCDQPRTMRFWVRSQTPTGSCT